MADILGPLRPEEYRRHRKTLTVKFTDADTPLADTPLSLRLVNALEKQGIMTVEQLGELSNQQISAIIKSGRHNNAEVQGILRKHGMRA